jgi:hypothetical protein
MRRDDPTHHEDDIDAPRTQRRTGHTDRLNARAEEQGSGTTVRRDWRSSRSTNRPPRRAAALPSSWQEFVIWLQHRGGLKYMLIGAAVLVLLLVVAVMLSGNKPIDAGVNNTPDTGQSMPPTVTPGVSEPTPQPLVPTGAQFQVRGTDTEGLFLRPDPSSGGAPITTLPEGTIVTVIGQDVVGPDRVWKNVRTADGLEGWVASDFVAPVQ